MTKEKFIGQGIYVGNDTIIVSPPVAIRGDDFDDLKNGCPEKTDDKRWMTYDYAKRYFHWKNHK